MVSLSNHESKQADGCRRTITAPAYDHDGIVIGVVVALEDIDRQDDAEFAGEIRHPGDNCITRQRLGQREVFRLPIAEGKEVGGEHLLQQDDVRALARRLPNQPLRLVQIGILVPAAGHLHRRQRHFQAAFTFVEWDAGDPIATAKGAPPIIDIKCFLRDGPAMSSLPAGMWRGRCWGIDESS